MQKSKQKDIEDYDRTQIPHPFPINQCLENKKNLLVQMLLIVNTYFKLGLNPTAYNLNAKDEIMNLFECQVCHKTFTKNNDLKRHRASIHDGKRFKCKLCSSS